MNSPGKPSSFTSRSRLRVPRFWLVAGAFAVSIAAGSGLRSSTGHPVLAFSKQSREAGAATFHEKGCEHCHGVDGIGTDRGPDLSGIGKRWHKDQIERQIREGGGGMPPFGEALNTDEVRSLVDFLAGKRKALHLQPKPAPKPADKPVADDSGQ